MKVRKLIPMAKLKRTSLLGMAYPLFLKMFFQLLVQGHYDNQSLLDGLVSSYRSLMLDGQSIRFRLSTVCNKVDLAKLAERSRRCRLARISQGTFLTR